MRRFMLVAMLVLLSGCGHVGVRPAAIAWPAEHTFDRALVTYALGNLVEAEQLAWRALEESPSDLRAHALLRAVLVERGRMTRKAIARVPEPPAVDPADPVTLLREVRSRSPEVLAAVYRVIEARARMREANLAVTPEFSLIARFYPPGVLARLTQSVYAGWWQREALLKQEEAGMLEALAAWGRVQQDVVRRAAAAGLELSLGEREMMLAAREREAVAEKQRVIDLLIRNGERLHSAALAAEVELRTADQAGGAAQYRIAKAHATLNALLNRAPLTPVATSIASIELSLPAELPALVSQAWRGRFEPAERAAAVAGGHAAGEVYLRRWPTLDLFATWGSADKDDDSILEGFGLGAVGASPLWPGKRRAARDRFDALVRQLELQQQQVHNQIGVEVIDAYHTLQVRTVNATRAGLEREARAEDLRVTETLAREQALPNAVRLIDDRLAWLRAFRAALAAKHELQLARLELGSAAGHRLENAVLARDPDAASDPAAVLAPQPGRRALWVWDPQAFARPDDAAFLVDFLVAQRFDAVYLFASLASLRGAPDRYRHFIALAKRHNVAVQALNGEPAWLLEPDFATLSRFIDAVAAFNASYPEAAFDAVHLDVEPHALPDWRQAKRAAQLLARYIDMLDEARPLTRAHGLALYVDAPYWLINRSVDGIPFVTHLRPRVDGVVLMSYGLRATKISDALALMRRLPGAADLDAVIGVSADPAHLCPATSIGALESDIASLEQALADSPGIQGIAIHDYARLTSLLLGRTAVRNAAGCSAAAAAE
jgi:outer membrane protein TolC